MEPVVAAVVVALLAPLAIWFYQGELRRRHSMLEEVADKYKGFALPSRLFSSPSLQVRVNGVDIVVKMWSARNGGLTAWRCVIAPPGTVAFRLTDERSVGAVERVIDGQDVELGNSPAFDRQYVVKTGDAPAVARLFAGTLGDRMLDWFPHARLESDGSGIELAIRRLPMAPSEIEQGIELVAAIASADIYGLTALRAVAGARYHTAPLGGLPHITLDRPGEIRIGPELLGGRATTRARTRGIVDVGLSSIEVIAGEPAPGADLERLSPGALEALRGLGTADVGWSDNEVSVTWRGIETDRRRLTAAVRLLRELGRPSLGVFR